MLGLTPRVPIGILGRPTRVNFFFVSPFRTGDTKIEPLKARWEGVRGSNSRITRVKIWWLNQLAKHPILVKNDRTRTYTSYLRTELTVTMHRAASPEGERGFEPRMYTEFSSQFSPTSPNSVTFLIFVKSQGSRARFELAGHRGSSLQHSRFSPVRTPGLEQPP